MIQLRVHSMAMSTRLIIGADDDGRRLDRLLRKSLGDLPLSAIHRLLRTGRIRVDGKKASAADRLRSGSVLELPELEGLLPPGQRPIREGTRNERANDSASAERAAEGMAAMRLDILWQGGGLLVVSKPAGLLIHGPNSLEDMVLEYLEGKLAPSLSFRPGPLHRLDRGTSGIVTFSTSLDGARRFSEALRERRLRKRYLALLSGELTSTEVWEDDLVRNDDGGKTSVRDAGEEGGKRAHTRIVPLQAARGRTLALVEIGTGRTHQIRAQAAAHGYPLAGDRKYGGDEERGGFLLHAYELASPREAALPLPPILVAPPPAPFLRTVEKLFGPALAQKLASALPTDAILDAIM